MFAWSRDKHLSMRVDLNDEGNLLTRLFGGWSSRVWGMQADPLGLSHQRAKVMRDAEERRGFQFVQSPCFQLWCYTMIMLNAVYMGFNAQIELDMAIEGQHMSRTVLIVEALFSAWFLVEVIVRCGVMPWLWFFGPECRWNMLDTVLVLLSIIDFVISVNAGIGNISEMSSARILRLARFIRLVRLAHAIRLFHSLRVVVLGIIASTKSMYWVFLVVAAINYVFAVFFLQGTVEHVSKYGPEDPLSSELIAMFGDVFSGMTTLFMTITGGVDWGDVLKSLKNTKLMYQAVLLLYVFLMYFAVLNVVIGAVVTATAEISNTDKEILVKSELLRFEKMAKKLKAFFVEADVDQSGVLSWEEFETHLKNDRVKAHFQALELEVSQAHSLFRILDADGSDSVGLDEFVQGCMRLKGQAKGLDIRLLMYQNEIAFTRLKKSMDHVTNAVDVLEQKVLGNRPGQNTGVRDLRKCQSEFGPNNRDKPLSEGSVKLVEFP